MPRRSDNLANQRDEEILQALEKFVYDPYGFVLFAYPWNEAETILSDEEGPDEWQTEMLKLIGERMYNSQDEPVQIAIRSGHGIGKTAFLAWLQHWFISTRPNPQIVVTANTKPQLETKTWRELAKWHQLSIHRHWFKHTATKFEFALPHNEKGEKNKTWFASCIPWSKERSESFQGTHEQHVCMIFDEASNIDDIIWEVTEGAMTTPGSLWVVCGNPTRNTGRFSDCWKAFKHRWVTREIDSRTAKKAEKKKIQQWIDDYGEDSDFVRVRVLGKEPRAGATQMIGSALVEEAASRVLHQDSYRNAAKVLGVDVARFGDDQTVIIKRQGLQSFDLEKYRGLDTMATASIVSRIISSWEPDATFVDEVGIGAGVVDRLRELGYTIMGVNAGRQAVNPYKFVNKRAEMWHAVKEWMESGGAIPNDRDLKAHLVAPEYGFDNRERIQLERKIDVKQRLGESPDCADALTMTFAEPVVSQKVRRSSRRFFAKREYDELSY